MKQEIQVAARTPAVADYWTQGQSAVGASSNSSAAPAQSPLKRIHRLLRGRYPLAAFLLLVGGLAGAMAGFVLLEPKFQSEGLIKVNPEVSTGNLTESTTPMVGMMMSGQTTIIMSPGVAEEALKNPDFIAAWKKAYPNADPMTAIDFIAALDAEHEKNSFNIKVTFLDKNKDVAQAGTSAAIHAYMDKYGNSGATKWNKDLRYDTDQREKVQNDLKAQQAQLAKLGLEFTTTDLDPVQNAAQNQLNNLDAALSIAQKNYDNSKDAQGLTPTAVPDKDVLIYQIAASDGLMRTKVIKRDSDVEDAKHMKDKYGYGPNYPVYKNALASIDDDNAAIDKYLQEYQHLHEPAGQCGRDGPGVLRRALKLPSAPWDMHSAITTSSCKKRSALKRPSCRSPK